jgi:hypothetical protein
MKIEVLVFDGCPNAAPAMELVHRVARRLAPNAEIERICVETAEDAERVRFLGSPSIRVNGRDIEDRTSEHGTLCCRTYEGGSGVPAEGLVEAAVVHALTQEATPRLDPESDARAAPAPRSCRSRTPGG